LVQGLCSRLRLALIALKTLLSAVAATRSGFGLFFLRIV
jgi:hypothetical protein